jgi:hypothetical protein
MECTEVKEGWNNTFDNHLDVLKSFKSKATHFSVEKVHLVDRNDAVVGDNPEVKIILGPNHKARKDKEEYPDEKEKHYEEKVGTRNGNKVREVRVKSVKDKHKQWCQSEDYTPHELHQNDEPVFSYFGEYYLSGFEFNFLKQHTEVLVDKKGYYSNC